MTSDNICLLLGAGISVEQSLPEWEDLVLGVIKYFNIDLNVSKENLTESIGIIEDNILETIIENAESQKIFFNHEQYQFFARRQIAMAAHACLKQNLINRTLNDVVSKMEEMRVIAENAYSRAQEKKDKKRQLTTIITYNFDDYFEFCFKQVLKEHGELDCYSKYLSSYTIGEEKHHLPSGKEESTPINVYHVHGLIPVFDEVFGHDLSKIDKETYMNNQKNWYEHFIDCGIIFSGNDYNNLMDDVLVGWTNMIQYICYSQLPVSIVGFSLTDANFRILIRRMKKSMQFMKCVTQFIGHPIGEEPKLKKQETEYILSSVCSKDNITSISCVFGKEYAEKLNEHLLSFL